jgi:hypothetical protein
MTRALFPGSAWQFLMLTSAAGGDPAGAAADRAVGAWDDRTPFAGPSPPIEADTGTVFPPVVGFPASDGDPACADLPVEAGPAA